MIVLLINSSVKEEYKLEFIDIIDTLSVNEIVIIMLLMGMLIIYLSYLYLIARKRANGKKDIEKTKTNDYHDIIYELIHYWDGKGVTIPNYSCDEIKVRPIEDYEDLREILEEDDDLAKYEGYSVLEFNITMNLKGDYDSVNEFIGFLEKDDKHISLNHLSFSSFEEDLTCSMQIHYIGLIHPEKG